MSSPSAMAIFVGGASLLHLRPKFSVTITFTIMGIEFGNSAIQTLCYFDTHCPARKTWILKNFDIYIIFGAVHEQ